MNTLAHTARFQLIQVPADGHLGGTERFGELSNANRCLLD
jgi:hypothetical protein